MSDYDLKSLNLPKLTGSMLNIFAAVTGSKLTPRCLSAAC